MCGCAIHAFYLGRRTGVQTTVDYLVERGVLIGRITYMKESSTSSVWRPINTYGIYLLCFWTGSTIFMAIRMLG